MMDLLRLQAVILSEKFRKNMLDITLVESDDEEWEEENALTSLIVKEYELRVQGKRYPQLRLANYVENIIPSYTIDRFRTHFRMMPATAEDIENKLAPILSRQGPIGRNQISPRKQILSVLWLLATPDSYRSVGEQFGMSKSTLHHCFRRVIHALCGIAKQQIFWPQGHDEKTAVQEKFQRIAGMPNVIGAIDGCQIEIDAPKDYSAAYRTGKKKYAMQLQAVCTSELLMMDAFAGYPGSVHDARILKNSPLFRDAGQIFLGQEYLVADKAYYPVHTWCIPPYKNFQNLTQAETAFNSKHSKTRQVIERCFCLLKGRFRRLKHLTMHRTDEMSVAILAVCVLHNICLRGLQDQPEHIEEYVMEGMIRQLQTDEENAYYRETSSTEAIDKRNHIKDIVNMSSQ